MYIIIMPYSVSVQSDSFGSIQVSGDVVEVVVMLVNALTSKFFSTNPAAKIKI